MSESPQAGRSDRRVVVRRAAEQQVVTRLRHVADRLDGLLAGAAGGASADPRHPAVGPRRAVRLRHHLDHVATADVDLAAPVVGARDPGPALVGERVAHVVGDLVAAELRHPELLAGLQHAVLQQVVEAGIQPLDDQRRQRGDDALGRLDHVAHDVLERAGDAVQLLADGVRDIEVAAHQVRVPLGGDAEAQRRRPRRGPQADRLRAAEAVQELVVGRRRQRGRRQHPGKRRGARRSLLCVRSFHDSYQSKRSHCPRRLQHRYGRHRFHA